MGDSLTVFVRHLLCAGLPEGSHVHMWLYICVYKCTLPEHNSLTKDPVLFQDCDDPSHLLVDM